MFSTHPKENFCFQFTYILSSANALILDQSNNLSFGKKLKIKFEGNIFSNNLSIIKCQNVKVFTQYLQNQVTQRPDHDLYVFLNPFQNDKFWTLPN